MSIDQFFKRLHENTTYSLLRHIRNNEMALVLTTVSDIVRGGWLMWLIEGDLKVNLKYLCSNVFNLPAFSCFTRTLL